VSAGGDPPLVLDAGAAARTTGPDTVDCVAPAERWEDFWREAVEAKRRGAAWLVHSEPAGA
jgi:hypothetical protein